MPQHVDPGLADDPEKALVSKSDAHLALLRQCCQQCQPQHPISLICE